jgi:hypothetical protein
VRIEGKKASYVSPTITEPLALNEKLGLDKPDSGDAVVSGAAAPMHNSQGRPQSGSQPSQLVTRN